MILHNMYTLLSVDTYTLNKDIIIIIFSYTYMYTTYPTPHPIVSLNNYFPLLQFPCRFKKGWRRSGMPSWRSRRRSKVRVVCLGSSDSLGGSSWTRKRCWSWSTHSPARSPSQGEPLPEWGVDTCIIEWYLKASILNYMLYPREATS